MLVWITKFQLELLIKYNPRDINIFNGFLSPFSISAPLLFYLLKSQNLLDPLLSYAIFFSSMKPFCFSNHH
ncbi:hypothetical protein YC2023_043196 [Brassica napus]